ncbi:Transposable element Tc3 transposase [Dictyocoela muelleri]|nr:Transposable element Tc3 transposase [Dictyocoela muelleri]
MVNINESFIFNGVLVMVLDFFSYNGVGKIIFIDVIMDAAYYCNMLSSSLFESVRKISLSDYTFVQDNDQKHKSKLASEFFKTHDIKVLPWPYQSPNCNPIKNLLGIIKYKIGNKLFKTKEDLKSEILLQ